MQTKAPVVLQARHIQSEANAKTYREIAHKRKLQEGKTYMNGTHKYEMKHGDTNTGIHRTMLGREAKLANDLSEINYRSGKSKRLYRWCIRTRFVQPLEK